MDVSVILRHFYSSNFKRWHALCTRALSLADPSSSALAKAACSVGTSLAMRAALRYVGTETRKRRLLLAVGEEDVPAPTTSVVKEMLASGAMTSTLWRKMLKKLLCTRTVDPAVVDTVLRGENVRIYPQKLLCDLDTIAAAHLISRYDNEEAVLHIASLVKSMAGMKAAVWALGSIACHIESREVFKVVTKWMKQIDWD